MISWRVQSPEFWRSCSRGCAPSPSFGRAIASEDGRTDVANVRGVDKHGAELFTRGVQSNAGLGFGVLIFGVAMGARFAVPFCVMHARVGNVEPQVFSVLLAAGAFIVGCLVAFVKYPANPPAVGQADTIGARTGWYLVAVLTSVVLAFVAVWLARTRANRLGLWNAGLLAAGAYVLVIALVMALLPSVDETP